MSRAKTSGDSLASQASSRQWVLVRGIMSEAFHWWNFIDLLQAQFPNDKISTADILGNGELNNHRTPLKIKANIQGLKAQAPSGKKILVGFSLGGMLSLEWAYAHPEEVEALVLINCSLNNSKFYERLKPSSFKNIVKLSLESDLIEREKHTLRMTTSLLTEDQMTEIARHWGPRGVQYPVKSMNFVRQSLLAAQMSQKSAPPAPTLILSSKNDKVVDPICSVRIANQWKLTNHLHPAAGHDLTLDDPAWALGKINDFLQATATSVMTREAEPANHPELVPTDLQFGGPTGQ